MNEMTNLEKMKPNLPEGTSKDDHRYVVENFAAGIFTNADKDERTCETITKKNAVDFNTASHFIMLISSFGCLRATELTTRHNCPWNIRLS